MLGKTKIEASSSMQLTYVRHNNKKVQCVFNTSVSTHTHDIGNPCKSHVKESFHCEGTFTETQYVKLALKQHSNFLAKKH